MLVCYTADTREKACPIEFIVVDEFKTWCSQQAASIQAQINALGFEAKPESFCILLNNKGERERVLLGVCSPTDVRAVARLPLALPEGVYCFDDNSVGLAIQQASIYWGLGAYQFTAYKKAERLPACLLLPKNSAVALIENIVSATCLGRDLINTPAEDMSPIDIAEEVASLAATYDAEVKQIVDEELLTHNFPAIFTVGRAAYNMPRLIDLNWGNPEAPKVTLVGKGVCFDTGGLDLKPANNMLLMKKDMGGAAHVIALAKMIMQENLPICLRVLIPAVENSISGDAYRPGDIIKMRTGRTVEIDNTDAEGRLVLADALAAASEEQPDLLIDMATLTGAGRVALGPQVGNLFSTDDGLARTVMKFSEQEQDYLWQMPLFQPYEVYLKSLVADTLNSSVYPHAGSITAALFLKAFVGENIPWLHCDVSGWSFDDRPGHPIGGDLLGARALFMYLRQRFSSRH